MDRRTGSLQEDYTYRYFSDGNLSDAPTASCNPVVMPAASVSGYVEGLNWTGAAWSDQTDCGVLSVLAPIPCHTVRYRTRVRAWYLDPGTTRTPDAPQQGTDPLWPATGSTPTRLASDMPPSPPRGAQTSALIADALAENAALRREIVHVFNQQLPEDTPDWQITPVQGGPATGQDTVPDCTDMTFTACVARIQTLGFTGTTAQHTLSAGDAIMEVPADRTTATSPAAGTQAAYDTPITIYVNPDPMPQMTAVQTLVATQLEQKNPNVAEEDVEKPFAYKTIAKRCVDMASPGSGVSPTDCGSFPIFVTGYDAALPAENDAAAIWGHASWFMLHRRSSRSHASWYDNVDGCRSADRTTFLTEFGFAGQCHEYPFWSTHQAYNGLLNDAQPRIQLTPPGQNSTVQGGALQQFYGTPRGFPFPPCNIPPAADQALIALPEIERVAAATASGSAFLNVPLGKAAGRVRTVGLCNDRVAAG